jgi:CHASE2 domain-containing sensor protein
MLMLRLLSVLAAGLVLIATPMTLDPRGHGMPGWIALFSLFWTALMAGSFLFVAINARRMRRHASERKLAGMLLLVPTFGALAMLFSAREAMPLMASGLLLAFTVLLMANVLVPGALGHTERRRRRRERIEPSALPSAQ